MGSTLEKARKILHRINENLNIFGIDNKVKRIEEIDQLVSEAYMKNDMPLASSFLQEQANLRKEVNKWMSLRKKVETLIELISEAESANDETLLSEFELEISSISNTLDEFEIERFFEELDNSNCFFNIHPGAGGTESCDWAAMLFRMYTRYFEKKGFKYEIVDFLPGEEAGIKDVTIYVQGPYAYGYLKSEIGIHRLIRISPFDASKRRHTSFCGVHVIPELKEDVKIDIDPSELKIETFRAGGKGGQHVNKTESAVRITHIPTGITVSIQSERSQIQNREIGMKILKSRLYEMRKNELKEKIDNISGPKRDISWGNQIRSYVLHPYNSVKDHRTEVETSNTNAVLDGNIDIFVNSYIKWAYAQKNKIK